jgi:hypothetical protein
MVPEPGLETGFHSNRISIRPQKGLKPDLDPSGSAAYKLSNKYYERLIVIFLYNFVEAFLLQSGLICLALGVGPGLGPHIKIERSGTLNMENTLYTVIEEYVNRSSARSYRRKDQQLANLPVTLS